MEIIATLNEIDYLKALKQASADGIIFGGPFSLRFAYDAKEFHQITKFCKENALKCYISIDSFISEQDKPHLYRYLDAIKHLDPDGIYFTDLGVLNCAQAYGLQEKLIYDPDTLLANSLDTAFYLKNNIGAVLARELTLNEITKIIDRFPNKLDLQVFGHLKLSYSKRKFLTNYFKHFAIDAEVAERKDLSLVEESRSYRLPVVEDTYGTRIYSDYIFMMYRELVPLKAKLKRAIVDGSFLSENLFMTTIRDLKSLNAENAGYIEQALYDRFADENFSSGYLYRGPVKVKEDE